MHYDGTLRGLVSINNPILKDKKTGKSIGINKKMSPLDIQKLNNMYPCKSRKPTCGEFRRALQVIFIDYVCLDPNLKIHDEVNVLKKKRDDLNEKLEYFKGNLLSVRKKINTLDKKNKELEDQVTLQNRQLTSDKTELENLRNRIMQLEAEKTELQSGCSQYQKETTIKVRDLTNENQNFRNTIDAYKMNCEQNGLSANLELLEPKRTPYAKKEDYDKSDEPCVSYKIALIAIS